MRPAVLLLWLVTCAAAVASADLAPEPVGRSATLEPAGPHWALYLDMQKARIPAGRYVLFDADSLDFKAHIPAGQFPGVHVSPDGRELYVISTWLHGPRAERHDVVAVYDTTHYAVIDEIPLPSAKRALMGPEARSALIAGGQLLVLFGFTPATSLEVIDVRARKRLAEVSTPGCALVYPTGDSGVSMLCGDGSLLTVHFDAAGGVRAQHRSEPFFDPEVDPIMEHAARIGAHAYFASYGGRLYPVDLSGERPVFEEPWPLAPEKTRARGWRKKLFTMGRRASWLPGGVQLLTAHERSGELFVLMHPTLWSGGEGDHVFPGAEVWVYAPRERRLLRRMSLEGVASSIYITPDAEPLLLASGVDLVTETMRLEVYDVRTGKLLRWMPEYGDIVMGFHAPFGSAP
jgi:methylamine dehydrogenase heavy chain